MKYLNLLIIFLLLLFSCKSEKENLPVTPKNNNNVREVKINGIFDNPYVDDVNNVVFAEKFMDHIDLFLLSEDENIKSYVVGEVSIFSVDKNMNMISTIKTWSSSSGVPFIESDRFLALGFFNQETYLSEVIILNKVSGILSSFNLDVKFIAFLGIIDSSLYIYKEQADDTVCRLDLENGSIYTYKGYLESVDAFVKGGDIYLYDYYKNESLQIMENEIIQIDEDARNFVPAEIFSFSSLLVDPRYPLVVLKKPVISTISP